MFAVRPVRGLGKESYNPAKSLADLRVAFCLRDSLPLVAPVLRTIQDARIDGGSGTNLVDGDMYRTCILLRYVTPRTDLVTSPFQKRDVSW